MRGILVAVGAAAFLVALALVLLVLVTEQQAGRVYVMAEQLDHEGPRRAFPVDGARPGDVITCLETLADRAHWPLVLGLVNSRLTRNELLSGTEEAAAWVRAAIDCGRYSMVRPSKNAPRFNWGWHQGYLSSPNGLLSSRTRGERL